MSDRTLSIVARTTAGLALVAMLASVPFSYLSRAVDLPPDFARWPATIIALAPAAAFVVVGGLIASRRPRNAYGWVMMANGIGQGSLLGFWTSFGIYAFHALVAPPLLASLAFFLTATGWILWFGTLPLLTLLYPNGELPSPRWKIVIWLAIVAMATTAGLGWLTNTQYGWIAVDNPFALGGEFETALTGIAIAAVLVIFALILVSASSLILRAVRSTGVERQQYKWFALAVSFFLVVLISDLFWEAPEPWESVKEAIPGVFVAVAIGIAVSRYRLFEIDTVIRKTAQYAIVTGLLAAIYFGIVVLLQRLFSNVTGQTSTITVVLSTLLIAAMFNPIRKRVQDFIDRRFYRRKYDTEKVLNQFATTVRDETDLEQLTAEILRVIQETMQPESVSLWLKPMADDLGNKRDH
jgi:hypothetical protein